MLPAHEKKKKERLIELQILGLIKVFIKTPHLDLCSTTLKFTYFLSELC